jgi:O-methyltransferase
MAKVPPMASAARKKLRGRATTGPQVDLLERQLQRQENLNRQLEKAIKRLEKQLGGEAKPAKPAAAGLPADFDEEAKEIIKLVRPFTMTSPDKLFALITAVRYLATKGVEGAMVECGVWRGGSMHAVARILDSLGKRDRELFLFDTYTGMTEPTDKDVNASGKSAAHLLEVSVKTAHVWAVASIEDVQEGLDQLDYPAERFHLVKGPVEETIPGQAPERIALLRLDTDWYASTKHELEQLYSRLAPGGVLIIDDYGSWQGAKEATDEFIGSLDDPPMMLRAGRSRIGVKPGS